MNEKINREANFMMIDAELAVDGEEQVRMIG